MKQNVIRNNIPIHLYIKDRRVTKEQWTELKEANKPYLMRFFSNVEYIRKKRNWSLRHLAFQMKVRTGMGIGIGDSVRKYAQGKYTQANMIYLMAYCLTLGQRLDYMLFLDYEYEEQNRGRNF